MKLAGSMRKMRFVKAKMCLAPNTKMNLPKTTWSCTVKEIHIKYLRLFTYMLSLGAQGGFCLHQHSSCYNRKMKALKINTRMALLLWKLNISPDGPERVNCFRAQIFSFPCLRISTRRFMCNEFPITDLHQLGCQSACLYCACLHLPMFSLHVEAPSSPRNTHKSM